MSVRDRMSLKQMPRVCFVSRSYAMHDLLHRVPNTPTGGAEFQQVTMSRALVNRGVPVEFLLQSSGSFVTESNQDGVRITLGIQPPSGPKCVRAARVIASTLSSLRRVNADVYYVRSACSDAGYVGLYSRLTGAPFVFGVAHNMDLDGGHERKMSAANRVLYRLAVKHASAVFVQTDEQMEMLRRYFGREGILIRNICPIDGPPDGSMERDLVLWVGRFRPVKRPEWMLELAARIPEQKFVMIGGVNPEDQEIWDRVSQGAQELGNLELLGHMSAWDIEPYYKRARLLVLTSEAEGFPNVVLEAWRAGTPTVSTFDPDGLISTHQLGYHCRSFDEMTARVRELLQDETTRAAMGVRAFRYVSEHHAPDVVADRLIEAFSQVSRNGHRPAC